VINTGRSIDSALEVQRQHRLFFPGTYLIGFNGGQIYDCDNECLIYRASIPMDITEEIFRTAHAHDVHCHTFSDTHIVTPDNGECMEYYTRVIHTPVLVTADILSALQEGPSKCIAIELHDHEKMEHFRTDVSSIAPDRLQVMYSNPFYLEIFPKETGKGSAVKRLCDILNIPIENSLAAGDEQNDISMIKAAACGIAMQNATAEVKAAADVITIADNNHDGLRPYL
jgi:Cof subfamily protein (haloacid dehalogenase superfamily)